MAAAGNVMFAMFEMGGIVVVTIGDGRRAVAVSADVVRVTLWESGPKWSEAGLGKCDRR